MALTVYVRKCWRKRSPSVSISLDGEIVLNAPMTEIFHQKGVERVLLLSDREQRKIAVQPIVKGDKRSYSVVYHNNFRQAFICAKSFLTDLGWDKKRHQLDAKWDSSLLAFRMPNWVRTDGAKVLPITLKRKTS